MTRYVFLLALGIAVCALGMPGSAQVPGRGFSALLCVAEEGPQPGNAQVSVSIDSDTGPDGTGFGSAQVTITHGASSSTHVVVYYDANESGQLDCRDVIASVT